MNYAAVFPGQGSQSVGMLADLYQQYQEVRDTFAEAAAVLGVDLWALCQDPNQQNQLNQTTITQPLMLTANVAVWQVWRTRAPLPIVAAGHSLGEYSALVAAGVMDFATALHIVAKRAALMQKAVSAPAAMAAIMGLGADAVHTTCQQLSAPDQVVELVNLNSPAQMVIAGHQNAVEKAVAALKAQGARRAVVLPISVPAHSSLMQSCAADFAQALAGVAFNAPQFALIQNHQNQIPADQNQIAPALVAQLSAPVDFVGCVEKIHAEFAPDWLLELGAGKVLGGLVKRINADIQTISICDCAQLAAAWELLS